MRRLHGCWRLMSILGLLAFLGTVGCASASGARPDPVVQPGETTQNDPTSQPMLPCLVFRLGAQQPVSLVVYQGHQCSVCEEVLARAPFKVERIAPGVVGISRALPEGRAGAGTVARESMLRGALIGVPRGRLADFAGARPGEATSLPPEDEAGVPALWIMPLGEGFPED